MQTNNYYSTERYEFAEDTVTSVIKFNPQHQIFEGHFPGQPVVPGVCMVEIVKKLTEQALDTNLLLTKGHQLKFLQLVVPDSNDAISVEIKLNNVAGVYAFNAVFKKEEVAVFKMSGEYTNK